MTLCNVRHPAFVPSIIDIEASGFGANSYPIEIGVIRSDGERFCRLLSPYQDWDFWDPSAESLHGISRETLVKHGIEGRELCQQLNHFLQGRRVYTDGWVVDEPWLIKLYNRAQMSMTFTVSAIEYILSEQQMLNWSSVRQTLQAQSHLPRHRASADAQIIQQTYLFTRNVGP